MTKDSLPQIKQLGAAVPLAVLLVGTLFSLALLALPLVAWATPLGCH